METIRNYLNNMFATLPKTAEVMRLKEDLLVNMEDKYHELINAGKSENEAIGIVISEFGNLDELIKELDIETDEGKKTGNLPVITREETDIYLEDNIRNSKLIGFGVLLCILGSAALIVIIQLAADGFIPGVSEDSGALIGVGIVLLFVAIAVAMFIYTGTLMEKYRYLKDGFVLPVDIRAMLEKENAAFQNTYNVSVIIAVFLCIVSPLPLFIASAISDNAENYGVAFLLLLVSIAVYMFIFFGGIKESYKRLLKNG
ncbi:hypothetical protein SAMN05421736_1067 [Evansella caseinilytica]|uniref:Uncharacterized protein n=1 Tax=Evansella caseinilytica TaxID=1503961 RepID=A0A1H3Q648_9BACI|nr:permease prefix domain 1-containing protein [Evansella caseinilytica]SDZ08169.1 hypothetical protein SAMN05421736_1067 [Evansella caseinilytica]